MSVIKVNSNPSDSLTENIVPLFMNKVKYTIALPILTKNITFY